MIVAAAKIVLDFWGNDDLRKKRKLIDTLAEQLHSAHRIHLTEVEEFDDLERCVLGLPSIVITVAENQEKLARDLHDIGAVEYLGACQNVNSEMIFNAVQKYMKSPVLLKEDSQKTQKLWTQPPQGGMGVASEISKFLKWPK